MSNIQQIITDQVLALSPYHVAEVNDQMLKLDAMECPQAFPQHLKSAWLESIANVDINRYPKAHNRILENQLRKVFGISDQHDVLLGNGSDEFIQMITLACARKDAKILAPAPTFVMYQLSAKLMGLSYISVDLKPDFSLDMTAMIDAIREHQPAVIYLATPNNPTGIAYSLENIQRIIDESTGLVIIDEAYMPFNNCSTQCLVEYNEDVLVMRTLSKTGFAGLRFGYLFGAKTWISELNKVRPPYNVNVLTQASIEFALTHFDDVMQQCQKIIQERDRMIQLLNDWQECRVSSSQANFILLQVPDAGQWFDKLKSQNILVKNLHGVHSYLDNTLRLTVSNVKENRLLIEALEQCR